MAANGKPIKRRPPDFVTPKKDKSRGKSNKNKK